MIEEQIEEKRFLVDVGIRDLPFPIKVVSKYNQNGQSTIANISVSAHIMNEFEAHWIDRFIQAVHDHREKIGTEQLQNQAFDFLEKLDANMVEIIFRYLYFIEKLTPVSKEKCQVRYMCQYAVKALSADGQPKIRFKIEIPAITNYPMSLPKKTWERFCQLSVLTIELESAANIYPEDLVEIVDEYSLAPFCSFLTAEDQKFLIKKIHSEDKPSVVFLDEIKSVLAKLRYIQWYSVRCANFGMFHSYSTIIGTEKSRWIPFSGYDDKEI